MVFPAGRVCLDGTAIAGDRRAFCFGSAEDSFPKTLEWYFSVIAELGRAAAVTTSYTGNDHWPNLYAGAFTLVLVWLYVLNRRISWKEKVPRMLMLVFFLVSFADNQLDYIWHGMHFPQALPGRQSFLYILCFWSWDLQRSANGKEPDAGISS